MLTAEQRRELSGLAGRFPDHYMRKFCNDHEQWYRQAAKAYSWIGRNGPHSRRVLDIGCGFGYFLHVCKSAGESAVGIDIPDPLIEAASAILGVEYHPLTVTAFEPLPEVYRDLDLVTCFGVMFRHGHPSESGKYWGWPEYGFLARDICSRLGPDGRWVIKPNKRSASMQDFSHIFDVEQWTIALEGFGSITLAADYLIVTRI